MERASPSGMRWQFYSDCGALGPGGASCTEWTTTPTNYLQDREAKPTRYTEAGQRATALFQTETKERLQLG